MAVNYNVASWGKNGVTAPVWAGPVFLKVKNKFHFYKKQVINQSASVKLNLLGLLYYVS